MRVNLNNGCHCRSFGARKCGTHACVRAQSHHDSRATSIVDRCASAAGALAASLILLAPSPAYSQIEVVSAGTALQSARPLQEQSYDKGKVWLLLVGGAAGLFAATVWLENNESLFPAISRANQAMTMSKTRETDGSDPGAGAARGGATEDDAEYQRSQQDAAAYARSEEAVLRGLMEARNAVLKVSEANATLTNRQEMPASEDARPTREDDDVTGSAAPPPRDRESASSIAAVASNSKPSQA